MKDIRKQPLERAIKSVLKELIDQLDIGQMSFILTALLERRSFIYVNNYIVLTTLSHEYLDALKHVLDRNSDKDEVPESIQNLISDFRKQLTPNSSSATNHTRSQASTRQTSTSAVQSAVSSNPDAPVLGRGQRKRASVTRYSPPDSVERDDIPGDDDDELPSAKQRRRKSPSPEDHDGATTLVSIANSTTVSPINSSAMALDQPAVPAQPVAQLSTLPTVSTNARTVVGFFPPAAAEVNTTANASTSSLRIQEPRRAQIPARPPISTPADVNTTANASTSSLRFQEPHRAQIPARPPISTPAEVNSTANASTSSLRFQEPREFIATAPQKAVSPVPQQSSGVKISKFARYSGLPAKINILPPTEALELLERDSRNDQTTMPAAVQPPSVVAPVVQPVESAVLHDVQNASTSQPAPVVAPVAVQQPVVAPVTVQQPVAAPVAVPQPVQSAPEIIVIEDEDDAPVVAVQQNEQNAPIAQPAPVIVIELDDESEESDDVVIISVKR